METSIYDNDPVSDTFWVKPPAPSAWEASCQIKCEMRNVAQGQHLTASASAETFKKKQGGEAGEKLYLSQHAIEAIEMVHSDSRAR